MKRSILLTVALALAPVTALAQAGPPGFAGMAPGGPQSAAFAQMHAQMDAARVQTRARILSALSPQHRQAVANLVAQLVLSPNPNTQLAVQQLDAVFTPAEKQSIVAIDAARRTTMHGLLEQHRAAMEAALPADARAQMAQRDTQRQAFMQTHVEPASDPGAVVLRTLAAFGPGPGAMFGGHFH